MIEKAAFTNYKALRSATLDLGRLTVIAGPNSSGKTSILEALHTLVQLGSTPLGDVLGEEDRAVFRTRGAGGTAKIELEGLFPVSSTHRPLQPAAFRRWIDT